MRNVLLALVIAATACSRAVKVESTPAQASEASLKVTNTATQEVSVTVLYGGTELSVGSVSANSTSTVAVRGVPAGSTVRLKATLADGSRSYTREGVVLTSTYEWRVP